MFIFRYFSFPGTARRKSEKGDEGKNLIPAGTTAPVKRGPGRPPGSTKSSEAGGPKAAGTLEPPEKRAKTDQPNGPSAAQPPLPAANGYAPAPQPQLHQQPLAPVVAAAPPPPPVQAPPRPNPLKWNVGEVCDFVKSLPGCSEYVEEFAAQEIDGQALMLLKADHLMSAMSIKLGPALKICSHIEQIREELNRN